MAQDIYRDDLASKNRDPYMEEPRSTASYIREPSRGEGVSPFILAVAIAAVIALVAVTFVGVEPGNILNAPATTEQPVAPASR